MLERPIENTDYFSATAESYQLVDMLTSDVVFDQVRQTLEREVGANPDLQSLHELRMAEREAMVHESEAQAQGDEASFSHHASIIDKLRSEIGSVPEETQAQYAKLENTMYWLSKGTRIVDSDSIEAKKIIDLIAAAPAVQPEPANEPPFRDFMNNNEEVWGLPQADTSDYLGDRIFIADSSLPYNSRGNSVLITTQPGETLPVPLDIFVTAAGFKSWNGREGQGSYKDVAGAYSRNYDGKIHSSDLIRHYASLPSELPPVSDAEIFIQPDGTIFASNGGGDSHRIAAAILRGQETIEASNIRITVIDHNFLPSNDSSQGDARVV